MNVNSRLPDVGTTVFTVMSGLASEHGAINLSQGFPDFNIDSALIRFVTEAMQSGFNQYAPMQGVPMLRNAIGGLINSTYQLAIDSQEEITITAGATEALYSVISAFVSNGDEVIVFDPAYDSYNPAVRLNGGVPVHINVSFPGFTIDWDLVRRAITRRTRMIIINTPHNPLGTVLGVSDLQNLAEIAEQNNLIVLSDEVYERLIYDGRAHETVLRYPNLYARSCACYSFGKTLHATGWKVGYVVAPAHLTSEIRKTHQYLTFSVNTPMQVGLARYLEETDITNIATLYQSKRDLFLQQIKGSSLEPLPCAGSYFQLLSFKTVSTRSDREMAEELVIKHKIASIPISVFYRDKTDHKLLRFCFAKRDETLADAAEILRRI